MQHDRVVVMGWPVRGGPLSRAPATPAAWAGESRLYPPTLDLIRHAAQGFGILHGYHRSAKHVDNDLFFRIGLINAAATATASATSFEKLEHQIREFLSAQRPLIEEIRLNDISIAAYEDDQLPLSSTRTWSLADPEVTGSFVAGLFNDPV